MPLIAACSREPARAVEPPVSVSVSTEPSVSKASPPTTPRGLSCLARLYGGKPLDDGGWALELPSGRIAWDDGRTKTAAEQLDAPDLEDMLATTYPKGPITKVTVVDFDPGRARVEKLFEAAYGATEKEIRAALVPWKLRGHVLMVHRRALPAFERVRARIDDAIAKAPALAAFFDKPGGTFNYRVIAGTTRRSAHAFGIAVDIDTSHAHYWRNDAKVEWKNAIPQAIVDAFEAESFVWGGRWWHYDTMHFEWRPELFDAECVTP